MALLVMEEYFSFSLFNPRNIWRVLVILSYYSANLIQRYSFNLSHPISLK